ncbi:MAG TPA: universal stress protein [Candidatus Binatia bacterium]|nr:universal stress protein [Candidatus Binatia bacterium]
MADQKILCATDGTATSEKAVAQAITWAGQLNQFLAFITVVDGPEIKFLVWDEAKLAAGELPVDKALLAALERAKSAGLTRLGCVRASSPDIGQGIVTYAEKNHYRHIIVGSVGRTGTVRFLKGSVAADIVTLAHCPVTIVR